MVTGTAPFLEAAKALEPGDTVVFEAPGGGEPASVEVREVRFPKPRWREVVFDNDLRLHIIRGSIVDFTDSGRNPVTPPAFGDVVADMEVPVEDGEMVMPEEPDV